ILTVLECIFWRQGCLHNHKGIFMCRSELFSGYDLLESRGRGARMSGQLIVRLVTRSKAPPCAQVSLGKNLKMTSEQIAWQLCHYCCV
uniref:Uncharacterized protein n=1 Tax=Acanthochromis polyacanthus TaxID=80966 RepID=A0A3Q1F429_9TELE